MVGTSFFTSYNIAITCVFCFFDSLRDFSFDLCFLFVISIGADPNFRSGEAFITR